MISLLMQIKCLNKKNTKYILADGKFNSNTCFSVIVVKNQKLETKVVKRWYTSAGILKVVLAC